VLRCARETLPEVAAKSHPHFISPAARRVNSSLTKTTKLPLFVNGFAQVWPNRRRSPKRSLRACKLIREGCPAMTELTGKVGFASPISEKKFASRRSTGIELLATLTLVICLVIAATAVSIGMARAQTLGTVAPHGGTPLALLLGVVMAGMGGLTAMAARRR
jgi:hypothetical protein